MADSPDAVPDREDPVLVRPYIKTTTGVAAQERGPDETWPEPVAEDTPAPDPLADADTAVQPAIPATSPPYGLGVAPRLLILIAGIVVALAAVTFVLLDTDPVEPQRPSSVLPAVTGPAAAPTPTTAPGSAGSPAGPSVPASPTASVSVSVTPSPSVSVSAPLTPTASAPSPPPAVDRTGAITGAGGRCLAMGGLLGIDGSPVQVYSCMDISAQEFTLGADGSLRVGGKCARPSDDASVRVGGCDDQATGWQAGPGGTLVNGGQCLTDPGRAGANVRVAACSGGQDQSWTLP